MRFLSGPLLMACLLLTSGGPEKYAKSNQADTSQCGVITRALSDYSRIRVGAQRKDVERYFERDGGFQSPSGTRYTHPACSYLHLDVEYQVESSGKQAFSPDDTVSKVSRLYVQYPGKD
jgi:hypothetical protein